MERHPIAQSSNDQSPDQWLSRIEGLGAIKPNLRFLSLMV